MNIGDFLLRARNCQSDELGRVCGFYDNWPILIDRDERIVRQLLLKSGKFQPHARENAELYGRWLSQEDESLRARYKGFLDTMFAGENEQNPRLEYNPGTIVAHVQEYTEKSILDKSRFRTEDAQVVAELNQKYKDFFHSYLSLHPRQIRRAPEDDQRVMANVNEEVCLLLSNAGAFFCLPRSAGHTKEVSRVVFHPANLEGRGR